MFRAGRRNRLALHEPLLRLTDPAIQARSPFAGSAAKTGKIGGFGGALEGHAGQPHPGDQSHHPVRRLRVAQEKVLKRYSAIYLGQELSSWAVFLIGAISKIIATFFTYPYTLLRTRQQIKTAKKGETLGSVFREILEKEGFKGVFKGLTPKLIQTTLNSALLLMSYEKIRVELNKLG